MRIAFVGAGGVGGYFGARLMAAGNSVAFVARGAHLAAMRQNGLEVKSARGDLRLHPVEASEDARAIGPVDIAVVAVKLYDTEAAAEACCHLIGPGTAVVSLQNGVTGADTLRKAVGPERVFGGIAYIMATIDRPGTIVHTGTMARIVLGEFGGGGSTRVTTFAQALRGAGVDVEESSDIDAAIWGKFAFLAPLSGITSLARATVGPIRRDPGTRALFERAIAETVAVARARGIALPEDAVARTMAFLDGLPDDMGSSMYYDLRHGKRLELPHLSGAVVRLGREAGVATPTHDFIVAALGLHAAGAPAAISEANSRK
ncbi:MAG: 2-dehydropantoate 2-reductase [Rhodospirillales bacterium]|nr:2-dehydropantoate 2-reductase [Rhodospirillales bacterium]